MILKKFFSFVLIFIFLFPVNFKVNATNNNVNTTTKTEKTTNSKDKKEAMDELPSKSYILTDYRSGQVLYEKNADEKLPIASVTKIMTMLLVVEAIEEKKISLEDLVTATENAKPANGESSLWLEVGEKMSVRDLLKAVVINSANDAARTLAEYVAGSQEEFVVLMNEKAKKLNLKNTNFVNSTGLHEEEHYSSARDVSIMTKELLKHKWILNYTSTIKGKLRNGAFGLSNTNAIMLQTYKGCNGLKTGYTEEAGYCLCTTAIRNNMTLCAISLGSTTIKERTKTCTTLLDYGFNNFKPIKINMNEIEKKEIDVLKGKKKSVGCTCEEEDSSYLVKKTIAGKIKEDINVEENVKAPVKKGQILGSVDYVTEEGEKVYSRNIVACEDVEKFDFLYVFSRMFKSFFVGSNFYC